MKYPKVVTRYPDTFDQTSQLKILLFFDQSLLAFKGHFPNIPVLPGVAQTDFAIYFASQFLALDRKRVDKIQQLKFTKVIKPDMQLYLALNIMDTRLDFRYFDQHDRVYAIGKIALMSS
ncbi:ApeI family dehydratase [Facilibium subflavum]|uniref:ApeI family dehydratase n=1 Tax=Facilibium subflavum TaxID=2219058 RepID=UPI000E64698B|nr:thioester dehydrase [Facilibium subflavum]